MGTTRPHGNWCNANGIGQATTDPSTEFTKLAEFWQRIPQLGRLLLKLFRPPSPAWPGLTWPCLKMFPNRIHFSGSLVAQSLSEWNYGVKCVAVSDDVLQKVCWHSFHSVEEMRIPRLVPRCRCCSWAAEIHFNFFPIQIGNLIYRPIVSSLTTQDGKGRGNEMKWNWDIGRGRYIWSSSVMRTKRNTRAYGDGIIEGKYIYDRVLYSKLTTWKETTIRGLEPLPSAKEYYTIDCEYCLQTK